MRAFTKLQKEEALYKIDIRMGVVDDDPDSGDDFENTPGALQSLRDKVSSNAMNFTPAEAEFLKAEFWNCEDMAWSNIGCEGVKALGYAASMQNAIGKISQ